MKPQRRGDQTEVTTPSNLEASTSEQVDLDINAREVDDTNHEQDDDLNSEATETAERTTLPAKPRYTARMDHQFPISTVAVLADP